MGVGIVTVAVAAVAAVAAAVGVGIVTEVVAVGVLVVTVAVAAVVAIVCCLLAVEDGKVQARSNPVNQLRQLFALVLGRAVIILVSSNFFLFVVILTLGTGAGVGLGVEGGGEGKLLFEVRILTFSLKTFGALLRLTPALTEGSKGTPLRDASFSCTCCIFGRAVGSGFSMNAACKKLVLLRRKVQCSTYL